MTQLTVETEQLSAETTKLRQLYMELLSNLGGIHGPPPYPPSLDKDPPPHSSTFVL
jgi:hypothetical protein